MGLFLIGTGVRARHVLDALQAIRLTGDTLFNGGLNSLGIGGFDIGDGVVNHGFFGLWRAAATVIAAVSQRTPIHQLCQTPKLSWNKMNVAT